MRLAVTGTPGTGKTTLCRLLARDGWHVVGVEELAQRHGCIVGRDDEDDADVVDIEALADALSHADARWPAPDGARVAEGSGFSRDAGSGGDLSDASAGSGRAGAGGTERHVHGAARRSVEGEAAAAARRIAIDGHLSHLLPVDEVWVVRCDPEVLAKRLSARGYSQAKVAENVEAEALDLILQEALEPARPPRRVVQRDATLRSAEELLSSFLRPGPGLDDLEHVDWSHHLHGP